MARSGPDLSSHSDTALPLDEPSVHGAMNGADWLVLIGSLLSIVGIGIYRTRRKQSVDQYLKSGNEMGWLSIGFGVMATQASAITFLSTPGLGYESGLRFVQFYFGMPIAIVLISRFFLPIYYRLKVFTAYEFLEQRFDRRMRVFTAFLFLIQRGLAAGLTIYAPAIILSTILSWDLNLTILGVGGLVILYTVSGGSKAVSVTQKWQMSIILLGMCAAAFVLVQRLLSHVALSDALDLAGMTGRMQAIDTGFDWNERYTLWSGLTGGLFLALSYFGTDQSQVQRYLGGRSIKESRLGLLFNAVIKVPMQLGILMLGVLIYVLYLYEEPPIHFNENGLYSLQNSEVSAELADLQRAFSENHGRTTGGTKTLLQAKASGDLSAVEKAEHNWVESLKEEGRIRSEVKALIKEERPDLNVKDTNYVFLHFIMSYLPHGLIGLLLAVILSAAMSSTSGELSALSSTTLVDLYMGSRSEEKDEPRVLLAGRWITVVWGLLALAFALSARLFDNLIEMVNLLGSLFYGTILGIFLVAFFLKEVQARAVFLAAVIAESAVLLIHFGRIGDWSLFRGFQVEYLWYNVIGCVLLLLSALIIQGFTSGKGERVA